MAGESWKSDANNLRRFSPLTRGTNDNPLGKDALIVSDEEQTASDFDRLRDIRLQVERHLRDSDIGQLSPEEVQSLERLMGGQVKNDYQERKQRLASRKRNAALSLNENAAQQAKAMELKAELESAVSDAESAIAAGDRPNFLQRLVGQQDPEAAIVEAEAQIAALDAQISLLQSDATNTQSTIREIQQEEALLEQTSIEATGIVQAGISLATNIGDAFDNPATGFTSQGGFNRLTLGATNRTTFSMGMFSDHATVTFKRQNRFIVEIDGITSGYQRIDRLIGQYVDSSMSFRNGLALSMAKTFGYNALAGTLRQELERLKSGHGLLYASSFARPSLTLEPVEALHVTETVYFPGRPVWEPTTLKLMDVRRDDPVWRWLLTLYQPYLEKTGGQIDEDPPTGLFNTVTYNKLVPGKNGQRTRNLNEEPVRFKRHAYIIMLDGMGDVIDGWRLEHCWPETIDWQELDYQSSDICSISVQLRYDRAVYMEWDGSTLVPARTPYYEDVTLTRTNSTNPDDFGDEIDLLAGGGGVRGRAELGTGPGGGAEVWGAWDGNTYNVGPSNIPGFPNKTVPAGPDAGVPDPRLGSERILRQIVDNVAGDDRKSRAFVMATRMQYGANKAEMVDSMIRQRRGELPLSADKNAKIDKLIAESSAASLQQKAVAWARQAFEPLIEPSDGMLPLPARGPRGNITDIGRGNA